jgi:hypothetical protein
MVFLAAGAPYDTRGVDTIVALPAVCDAADAVRAPRRCDRGRPFVVNATTYFFIGAAAEMGMVDE